MDDDRVEAEHQRHYRAHFRRQCARLGTRYEDVLRELGFEDPGVETQNFYFVEQYLLRTYPGLYEECPDDQE